MVELYKRIYPGAIKNIKIYSTSLVFEKMQNKITVKYHYIPYQNGLNEKNNWHYQVLARICNIEMLTWNYKFVLPLKIDYYWNSHSL